MTSTKRMNPRNTTSSFSKREKNRRNPFNRQNNRSFFLFSIRWSRDRGVGHHTSLYAWWFIVRLTIHPVRERLAPSDEFAVDAGLRSETDERIDE